MKFPGKVGNGPVNKWLNFGGDPDPYPYRDTGGGMHCPSASSSVQFSDNKYTVFHKIGTPLYFGNNFFKC